jgi:hypothetical protein
MTEEEFSKTIADKTVEFRNFISFLDGTRHKDFSLLTLMYDQCNRVYEESGKPIAIEIFETEGMVYDKGIWGKDTYYELYIYAVVQGKYMVYGFSTQPTFDTYKVDEDGYPIWSQYYENQMGNKRELMNYKSFMWPLYVIKSRRAAKANFGTGGQDDAKIAIDGFYHLWYQKVFGNMADANVG